MLRFRDVWQEPLEWVQLRASGAVYELQSPNGVVGRVDGRAYLFTKQISAEFAEVRYRFQLAPMEMAIWEESGEGSEQIARIAYRPALMEFAGGVVYRVGEDQSIQDAGGRPLLRVERRGSKVKWRARLVLEPDAIWFPELPLLACWVCLRQFA